MNMVKIFTREFMTICTINFFGVTQFYMGVVILLPYAIEIFDVSLSIAGLVPGIYVLGVLIGRLTGGSVIGNFDSKKVLMIASIFYFVAAALYLVKFNLIFLIINRVFHGVAYGMIATATGTIAAQILPDSRKGEGIGYYGLSTVVAMAIGPFLAIFLLGHVDFNTMFLCNLMFALIGLILSFTKMNLRRTIPEQTREMRVKWLDITNYIEFKVIPIGSIGAVVAFVYTSVLSFLSLYSAQIHLEEASSYFFLVCAIVNSVTRPISGRIFDVKGANIIMIPSLIILASGIFLYSAADHDVTLLLAAALFGLGWGNFHSCAQAFAVKLISPSRYGVGTATYFILYEVGMIMSPYFCGYLIQLTGLRNLYLIMGVITLSAIVLYYFLQGRKERGTQ